MYYSFLRKYRFQIAVLGFLAVTVFLSSCHHREKGKKFLAPIEQVIQLDSSRIGVSTVISDLNVPWEIAWGPDGEIWFTEQSGRISKVDPHTGVRKTLLIIPGVYRERTSGLLGMAIDPDKNQPYLVVDYTCFDKDSNRISKLVRYTYTPDTLKDPRILLEVPAGKGHNGSRVAFSPDGKVWWATGDAQSGQAQNPASPNGKTLRLNIDGSIPSDNPIPGNPVWSRGHRNIEGLVFTPDGILFSSEHGEATDDEINIIQKGGNYGWPDVQGFVDLPREKTYADSTPIVEPIKAWTPTIAPSGLDYYHSDKIPEWNNALLLATLKGTSLRVLKLNKAKSAIVSEKIFLEKRYGRLRDVCVSPDGDVYVSTSNHDWNPLGVPAPHDDRILRIARINPGDDLSRVREKEGAPASTATGSLAEGTRGAVIYGSYCASCHKEDGKGITGTFPALSGNVLVTGDRQTLIGILLKGDAAVPESGRGQYDEKMPAFDFLNDHDIAAVLSYVRSAWDNKADSIDRSMVAETRKNLK